MKYLALFDIDGTLVDTGLLHITAAQQLYKTFFGMDVPADIINANFGKTFTKYLEDVLSALQVSSQQSMAMRDYYPQLLAPLLEAMPIKVFGGVPEFLEELQKREVYMGIVTGNVEQSARLILEKARLINFFQVIGCDYGFNDRKDVVQYAINEAQHKGYAFDNVVVIGDTTRDILAGKAHCALTVGVATGAQTKEQIAESKPDVLLSSLKEYDKILKLIT